MVAWDGSKTFNYWSTNQCNQVSGNSPGSLPLRINENEKMKLFFGPICRPLHFKFDKKVTIDNYFQTMRFIPEEKSFSSPDEVPENQCYCLQEPCLPSGLLDISGCKEGIHYSFDLLIEFIGYLLPSKPLANSIVTFL